MPITEFTPVLRAFAVSNLWATDEPTSGEAVWRLDFMSTPGLVVLAEPSLGVYIDQST
jgi:hypothetical protein